MIFKKNKSVILFGERIGFLFAYFLFTTVLYFILSFLGKLPASWSYFHIIIITFCIVLLGMVTKRLLR